MKKASEYRIHAEECRKLAGSSQDSQQKATLLRMADTWEGLAKDRENFIARKERIAALEAKPLRVLRSPLETLDQRPDVGLED